MSKCKTLALVNRILFDKLINFNDWEIQHDYNTPSILYAQSGRKIIETTIKLDVDASTYMTEDNVDGKTKEINYKLGDEATRRHNTQDARP